MRKISTLLLIIIGSYQSYVKNLLNTEVVQVVEQVKDWREAVAISCRPLIENGSIEPRYVDAIYHSHDTIGPYYVVGPGIAMPHARPEEGLTSCH